MDNMLFTQYQEYLFYFIMFIYFFYFFIGTVHIDNATENMPELAQRLILICGLWSGVKLEA